MESGVLVQVHVQVPRDRQSEDAVKLSATFFDSDASILIVGVSGVLIHLQGRTVVLTTGYPFAQAGDDCVEVAVRPRQDSHGWIKAQLKSLVYIPPPPLWSDQPLKWSVAVLELSETNAVSTVAVDATSDTASVISLAAPVRIVASPYGLLCPQVFAGCILSGIISHVAPASNSEQPSFFLTDARCFPGADGSPVFDATCTRILGLLLPPRVDGEYDDLPAVISWAAVWRHIAALEVPISPASNGSADVPLAVARALQHVTVIRSSERSWATAFFVSKQGHLMSAGHFVNSCLRPDARFEALVFCRLSQAFEWMRLTVIYHPPQGFPVDVCLLQLQHADRVCWEHHNPVASPLSSPDRKCTELQPVYAVGYPLNPFDCHDTSQVYRSCVITGGIVSLVVAVPSTVATTTCEVMIRTTATILNGHSGGLVVDHGGRCLGLISSNSKSPTKILARMNASFPLRTLGSIWAFVASDQDERARATMATALANLVQHAPQMVTAWSMQDDGSVDAVNACSPLSARL